MIPQDFSPIFVVGTGRSGTTLMSALLSAHSRITIPLETHYMRRAKNSGRLDGGPADFDAFWQKFVNWSRFRDLELDASACRSSIEASGDRSFRNIFATVLEACRVKEGKPRIGEKTPSHRAHVPTLFNWYPESRVIVLQRDPRAVVASQLKCPWVTIRDRSLRHGMFFETRSAQIAYYARAWRETYKTEVPAYLDDPRVALVQYENLVTQPEECMRQICGFLGEQFEPTMLEQRSSAKVAKHTATTGAYGEKWAEWVKDHHARTQKPISTASLDKWKKQLSAGEVAVIESVCQDGMAAAGYELTTTGIQRGGGRLRYALESTCGAAEQRARKAVGRLKRAASTR